MVLSTMDGESVPPTLSYASRGLRRPHASGGHPWVADALQVMTCVFGVLSLIGSVVVGSMGTSGDGFAQLAGAMASVPLVLCSGLLCTLPAIALATTASISARRRVAILIVGFTSLLAAGSALALCLLTPSHGGC